MTASLLVAVEIAAWRIYVVTVGCLIGGFGFGLWLGSEIGRIIYNRKMDELRGKLGDIEDLLPK